MANTSDIIKFRDDLTEEELVEITKAFVALADLKRQEQISFVEKHNFPSGTASAN